MASNDNTATMNGYDDVTCSCPRRQMKPPPLPTKLPNGLSPTGDNLEALKKWLLVYHSASNFNVCEHQPLSLIKCEHLKLHVDPKPHLQTLVPIHWQNKVYEVYMRETFALVSLSVWIQTPPHNTAPGRWLPEG